MFGKLRHLVSGPRKRFTDGDFDLDLSYITPNIISMGFPSSGVEATYRNPINKVVSMLNLYHPDSYLILNLSARDYDRTKVGVWGPQPVRGGGRERRSTV